ncbi:MAG TPA: hypothetical protein VD962_09680 [Rubricoccaceae bacterium]|nr:hypothetical protein [Rubricoccaceae bacterium]
MRLRFLCAAALLGLAPCGASAQRPLTALPFLEIPPSPTLNAMAGAGVALPSADPYAFLYNPAQAALAARDVAGGAALYPGGADWIGRFNYGSAAAMGGARIGRFALGGGLAQTALHFGEVEVRSRDGAYVARYEPVDRYLAAAVGASTTGAVRGAVGLATRFVSSTDSPTFEGDEFSVGRIWGFTMDLGAMAAADVARLVALPRVGPMRPALEVSAGYAQTHIGGTVGYSGSSYRDPLPRTALLGWAASAGLDLPLATSTLRVVQADLALQAEHSLVHRREDGSCGYGLVLGDMNVARALTGTGNEETTGRRGLRLALAETVELSAGEFHGGGYEGRSYGVAVRAAGPLKAAAHLTARPVLARLADHFDVRYTHAVYFAGTPNETAFGGLSLAVRR